MLLVQRSAYCTEPAISLSECGLKRLFEYPTQVYSISDHASAGWWIYLSLYLCTRAASTPREPVCTGSMHCSLLAVLHSIELYLG